jgi:hypothetical protein
MAESKAQKKTIEYARKLGYMAKRNYMGPGCEVGWPDVEIFMPVARVLLIEFKEPGEEPKKIQAYRAQQLRAMGHNVITATTFEEAKRAIDDAGN